ncbi:MAG TPA: hypothetical protein VGB24_22995 [Longimicrobium sp.]|jgi:hypothetical protein|uniref:hypothetical protein n=1 Tax=Longimicrobium sp. TaxID=2029185 RepID=UPI002EDA909D
MPKPTRKPRLRTIQPPHPSDKFTLEEVMEAWRQVEERLAARKRAEETGPSHQARDGAVGE